MSAPSPRGDLVDAGGSPFGAGGPFATAAQPPGDGIVAEINITPLTDVFLVLLIIFMVSSSAVVDAVREGRLDVSLPKAGPSRLPDRDDATLVIGVAADGRLFVKGHFLKDDELTELLQGAKQKNPQTVVVIDADGGLAHRQVVGVIDRVRDAGFNTVGIGAETSAP